MKNWSAGWLGLQQFLMLLLLSFGTSAQVHAAISEFLPNQPVVGPEAPLNRLPPPYGTGLYWVQVRDGAGGANARPGIDGINTLNFNVAGINSEITRVELLLAMVHPHLNDLNAELISPGGVTVRLFSGLSESSVPIKTRIFTVDPLNADYAGSIGGPIGAWTFDSFPLNPITLISDVDPDDDSTQIRYINDPTILDQAPASITYKNTIPPGTYFSQGDLKLFNGLSGTASATNTRPANGTWRIKIVDALQNNFITLPDGRSQYVLFGQGLTAAQLIITQKSGYKVWIGGAATGNNNWTAAANWDPVYGPPRSEPT